MVGQLPALAESKAILDIFGERMTPLSIYSLGMKKTGGRKHRKLSQ